MCILLFVLGVQAEESTTVWFHLDDSFEIRQEIEPTKHINVKGVVVLFFDGLGAFGNQVFQSIVLLVTATEVVDFIAGDHLLVQQNGCELASQLFHL